MSPPFGAGADETAFGAGWMGSAAQRSAQMVVTVVRDGTCDG